MSVKFLTLFVWIFAYHAFMMWTIEISCEIYLYYNNVGLSFKVSTWERYSKNVNIFFINGNIPYIFEIEEFLTLTTISSSLFAKNTKIQYIYFWYRNRFYFHKYMPIYSLYSLYLFGHKYIFLVYFYFWLCVYIIFIF